MPTRHRWTKEELTHLNRVVGQSKTKAAAFKQVAEEMGLKPETVSATYANHHRPKRTKVEKKPDQLSIFKDVTDEELSYFAESVKQEVDRRVQLIEKLKTIYAA